MKTTNRIALFSLTLLCASAAEADTFGSGANMFNIEFVTIGDPGNAADTTGNPNPAGSVAETYRIGKFEIPEDMINKANALGGLGLTHDNRGANKPVTRVSWLEAATFVNWLNTSTGSTPAYKFVNSNFQLWQPGDAGYSSNNLYRNNLATYFLPSIDEWYKAAYYDPMAGVYYDYPTGSDSDPDGINFEGDTTFDAVFQEDGGYRAPHPNDITDVGVLSPYGTAGQGGNVWEWLETAFDGVNDTTDENRAHRGGSWWDSSKEDGLRSTRHDGNVSDEHFQIGFRVAAIPSTPGDANGDGKVDGFDYVIWAINFGDDPADDPPGAPANGDFNFDGKVDGLDYIAWGINFGQGPNDATAVPEPATFAMLLMGVLACAVQRRRQTMTTAVPGV